MKQIKLIGDTWRRWREGSSDERAAMKQEYEALHQDRVRFMMPNGRFLPSGHERAPSGAGITPQQGQVIDPAACACSKYRGAVPGRHHTVCVHRVAWEASLRNVPTKVVRLPNAAVSRAEKTSPRQVPTLKASPSPIPVPAELKASPSPVAVPRPAATPAPLSNELKAKPSPIPVPRPAAAKPVVPSPETCACAKWKTPEKIELDQHNPFCTHYEAWKGRPWERKIPTKVVEPPPPVLSVPKQKVEGVPAPEACECASWKAPPKAEPDQHNPICAHYEEWKKDHPPAAQRPVYMVMNSEGEQLREASPDEVAQIPPGNEGGIQTVIDGQEVFIVALK